MTVYYLAAPYFDPDPLVREARILSVNQIASQLIQQGKMVFSPLTHNLPLAHLSGTAGNWDVWRNYDLTMLSKCDGLIVLRLPNWERSRGVAAEIEHAQKLGISIEWIDL